MIKLKTWLNVIALSMRNVKLKNLGVASCMIALVASGQVSAGDSISITCGNGKIVKVEKTNYKRGSDARHCARAGHPVPMKKIGSRKAVNNNLSAPNDNGVNKSLLLPAVQAASDKSPRQPTKIKPVNGKLGTLPSQAADTTCSGVNSCNDMIATCASLGGNSTATSYDPDTGAPNGATC